MIGAVRAELLKLRRSWATWILAAILVLVELLLGYLLLWSVLQAPPPGDEDFGAQSELLLATLSPGQVIGNVLDMTASLGGALILVLGAMNSAREYSGRTIGVLLTQRPTRMTMLLAKAVALAVIAALFAVVLFAAGMAGSALVAGLEGEAIAYPAPAEFGAGFAAAWLILGTWCAFGFALGFLLRSTGLAIGLGLVYALIIESIIGALSGTSDVIASVSRGLLGINAAALAEGFGEPLPPQFGGLTVDIDPPFAALVLGVWVVVGLLAAGLMLVRRDVA